MTLSQDFKSHLPVHVDGSCNGLQQESEQVFGHLPDFKKGLVPCKALCGFGT